MNSKEKAMEMAAAVAFCKKKGLLTSKEKELLTSKRQEDKEALAMLGYKALARKEMWEKVNAPTPMTDEEVMEALQDESRVVWRKKK